jgi:hypothetical protein
MMMLEVEALAGLGIRYPAKASTSRKGLPRSSGHWLLQRHLGLLLASFAGMRERGRTAALLHVDSANATGATALYESVGMRPVMVIDVWRRTSAV